MMLSAFTDKSLEGPLLNLALPKELKEDGVSMVERSTAYSYERKLQLLLNYKSVALLHLVGFLLGRAGILGSLTPFGIAFFAALYHKNQKYLTVALSIFIGMLTVHGISQSIPYGIALALTALVFSYGLNLRRAKVFTSAGITAAIYLVVGAIFVFIRSFFMYDLMMLGFEAVVIFVTYYISSYAIPIALQKSHRRVLATEEIICVAILMALTLSGINETYYLGLSLKNILGILITIMFAYNGGPGVGASVGVTLGLITSMSYSSMPPIIIGIFAFSGLLAGIFKDLGKVGSALGFLVGNIIITFYINGYFEVFIQLKEVIAAFVMFMIIPAAWVMQLQKFSSPVMGIIHSTQNYGDEMKKRIHEKLTYYSDTFMELSTTFENISDKLGVFQQEDLSKLIEEVAFSVCSECGMKRSCWDKNFFNTFQGLQELFLLIEVKDEVDCGSMPDHIQKRCIRSKEMIQKMVHLYELNRINMIWKKRLFESKELVGEQLKGVANGIKDLAEDVNNEIEFDTELEDLIYVAIDKLGIQISNLLVTKTSMGKLEVTIEKKPCFGRDDCVDRIIPVVSEVIGTQLVKKYQSCITNNNQSACRFTLVEANRYTASTKVARVIKDGNILSGDSYTFMDINNDSFLVALSDGMGAGESAHNQSSATITMLEKMMEAGFGEEMSIKTINSMLMLKSTEEIFSTVDMTLIDLHKGTANFAKIGSAPSFIKRKNNKVDLITSSSLPIGIISDIHIQENSLKLQDGDFIIMVSDGITEINTEFGEQWLVDYLSTLDTRNPQEMADKILNQALQFTGNMPVDDMTVLVTKVWKLRQPN